MVAEPRSTSAARAALIGLITFVAVAVPRPVAAHMMASQHGTLNLVGDGAYLVLSLPATALAEFDDDHDGRLSRAEARAHEDALLAAVTRKVALFEDGTRCPLEGLMLQLTPRDDAPRAPAAEVVALGRFRLASAAAPTSLRFQFDGFDPTRNGDAATVYLTVTRGPEQQLVTLTPDEPEAELLAPARAPLPDAVRMGVRHILGGFDHLLFLLVVVVGGMSWRRLLATLSCFTIGHATTLALTAFTGVCVPGRVVEPAIAGTIVAMAALDLAIVARGKPLTARWHLGLVFGCALVHGLGLASSLATLGLAGPHKLAVVAGFNAGIELGQLAVCAIALAVLALVTGTPRISPWFAPAVRIVAIGVGLVWFVERAVF